MINHSPWIAVTLGDPLGVGPEVTLKALDKFLQKNRPIPLTSIPIVLYGLPTHFEQYPSVKELANQLFERYNIQTIHSVENITLQQPSPYSLYFLEVPQTAKAPNPFRLAGLAAKASLKKAVDDLINLPSGCLITAPISKHRMGSIGFDYGGHTEYLAKRFDVPNVRMVMHSDDLRVLLETIHIPLENVHEYCSPSGFDTTLQLLDKDVQDSHRSDLPMKVAMLALNPHAGDGGHISNFEKEIMTPWIEQSNKTNDLIQISGPHSADGFFAHYEMQDVDLVWAMYHDQGLIPFKMLSKKNGGINRTLGLPILRVSPDHGSADDIAGQNKADSTSMASAFEYCYSWIINQHDKQKKEV